MKRFFGAMAITLLLAGGLGCLLVGTALCLKPESGTAGTVREDAPPRPEASGPGDVSSRTPQTSVPGNASFPAADASVSEDAKKKILQQVNTLAYRLLDEDGQELYLVLKEAIEAHKEEVPLPVVDEEKLQDAYQAVMCDYGGFFWVSGYQYTQKSLGGEPVELLFRPTYRFTEAERRSYQKQVDEETEKYLAMVPASASDYEKSKFVYELLAEQVVYREDAWENQTILSVLLKGESVCNGIASTAQYLLTCLETPSMLVYGVSQGEAHSWNLLELSGEFYHMDATWGNTASRDLGFCFYAYLNLSDMELLKTHQVDMRLALPPCTAMDMDYFYQEGLFLRSPDEASIAALVERAQSKGDSCLQLRCDSEEVYQQVFDRYITQGHIGEYLSEVASVSYLELPELLTLAVLW